MMKTGIKKETNRFTKTPTRIHDGDQLASRRLVDNRNNTVQQRQLIQDIENSPAMMLQRRQLEDTFGNAIQRVTEEDEELLQGKFNTVQRQENLEDEELLQGKFETLQQQSAEEEEEPLQSKFSVDASTIQRQDETKQTDNRSGIPDQLKAGIESLSGMDMSDVRVHYHSSKPAQLNALAYAQARDIHLGSGQEKHLPHEVWHVVQQAQGRVKATMQMAGTHINDDPHLEKEADVMGERAAQLGINNIQRKKAAEPHPIDKGQTTSLPLFDLSTLPPIQRRNHDDDDEKEFKTPKKKQNPKNPVTKNLTNIATNCNSDVGGNGYLYYPSGANNHLSIKTKKNTGIKHSDILSYIMDNKYTHATYLSGTTSYHYYPHFSGKEKYRTGNNAGAPEEFKTRLNNIYKNFVKAILNRVTKHFRKNEDDNGDDDYKEKWKKIYTNSKNHAKSLVS